MTTEHSISVLGATGKTGRRVAAQLRNEGHRVRAASRRGPHRFDWDDQTTWNAVVRDADGIYILPHEAPGGNERLATFTGLAANAGVRRLVLLSAREWTDLGLTESLEREDIVRDSGLAWTILRPVWFAQNFSEEPFFAKGVDDGELVHGTGEGRHPFVDVRDIAAVASAALTDERHAGQHYALTGARAISVEEAVAAIASATGRTIRTRALDADTYREYLHRHYPPEVGDSVVTLSERIRSGQDAYLSDGVQRALGREPRDFSEYVDEATNAGVWGR
ncbi:NAD(P)H-binding protein [uncultured Agrococcus sp.]|uniref:NAD(P)H-binding protein n=1 Tax=uncultured Agrococcus sp. TaxID=382258 RepID=UPI0025F7D722|nr:NAD(P)H-binding protein [uncultured Agrococcus sp.]